MTKMTNLQGGTFKSTIQQQQISEHEGKEPKAERTNWNKTKNWERVWKTATVIDMLLEQQHV